MTSERGEIRPGDFSTRAEEAMRGADAEGLLTPQRDRLEQRALTFAVLEGAYALHRLVDMIEPSSAAPSFRVFEDEDER